MTAEEARAGADTAFRAYVRLLTNMASFKNLSRLLTATYNA